MHKSRLYYLPFFLLFLICFDGIAQNYNFTIDSLEGNQNYLCSIELSPDHKTLAISTAKDQILFYDISSKRIIRKAESQGFRWGSYMRWSGDGNYLLLIQQYYTDWAMNKDLPSKVAVMDVSAGNILYVKNYVNTACFTANNRSLAVLDKGTITFYDVRSGDEIKKFSPPDAAFSFAFADEGKKIAVAQFAKEDDLKNIPSIRNDKKAIKESVKFRQVVKFYDAESFKPLFMADDIFDIVFAMRLSEDERSLFLFNAPNIRLRLNSGAKRNGYLQVADPLTGKVSRTTYATNAAEPVFKESRFGNYFAAASVEQRFAVINTVQVYNRTTGDLLKIFKNDFRILENTHIGRASFEFLPDGETMAIGYGNKLVFWKFLE
ncbi:MAG: WD40 repeat domain-containing protein [Bacteroidia bacterium]|nr:WD40 repeat domain-containing protein [Bacteroidia bacterium]